MAPKGKSAEEKAAILLRIYHEKKEPFNLKEIERDGSKAGVVQQTIKDINQSLIHDQKVQSDKMGSGVFFWSFPSKEFQDRKVKKGLMERQLDNARMALANAEESKSAAEASRNSSERPTKMRRLETLQVEEARLNGILEMNKKNDPEEISRVDKLALINQTCANRWTDNLWALKSYLVKQRGFLGKDVDTMLGMGNDFDYPDFNLVKNAKKGGKKK